MTVRSEQTELRPGVFLSGSCAKIDPKGIQRNNSIVINSGVLPGLRKRLPLHSKISQGGLPTVINSEIHSSYSAGQVS